jgi:type I restriction enzyme M protein
MIDEFSYDHSERLGDAFEYLLSVLGSQGDAGQFRTPRHIIDFIVAIVDPKKHETILDPACGTAGFLISSYKHILKNNLDENGYSTLTPDEKGRMVENFSGYDISPDMVRLSLVNMYLHGFSDPQIFEYDTLTSQERWNEYADVSWPTRPSCRRKAASGRITVSRCSQNAARCSLSIILPITSPLKEGPG